MTMIDFNRLSKLSPCDVLLYIILYVKECIKTIHRDEHILIMD